MPKRLNGYPLKREFAVALYILYIFSNIGHPGLNSIIPL
jgi:hypothetical protein